MKRDACKMERGLLWLPLLVAFFWLAWAGWNEYQKIEAYKQWASQFEKAKYDLYAVLGQQGSNLTWGKPTRTGPVNLETFSLKDVSAIGLRVGNRPVDLDVVSPGSGKAVLEFDLSDRVILVPFTEVPLAVEWGKYLQQELNKF